MENTTSYIYKKIIKCITEISEETKEINNNTLLNQVGIDSLKYVELVLLLEEEFNLEIKDSDLTIDNFETVEKIAKLVSDYMKSEQNEKIETL